LLLISSFYLFKGASVLILFSSLFLIPLWVNTYGILGIESYIKLNYPLLVLLIMFIESLLYTPKMLNNLNNVDKIITKFFLYFLFNAFLLSDRDLLRNSYSIIFPFLYYFLLRINRGFDGKLNKDLVINIIILTSVFEAIIFALIFITRNNPFIPPSDKYDITKLDWIYGPIFQPFAALAPTEGSVIFNISILLATYQFFLKKNYTYFFYIIILLAGNYLSLSRTGFILSFITIISIFLLYRKYLLKKIKLFHYFIIVITFITIYFLYNTFTENFIRKLESKSTIEKIEYQIIPAINYIKEKPLNIIFGIGYEKWRVTEFKDKDLGGPIHQTLLAILIELGIIGLLLWFTMFKKIIFYILKNEKVINNNKFIILGRIIIVSIVIYLISGILQPHQYIFSNYVTLFLLLAFYQNEIDLFYKDVRNNNSPI
jgi:O-antigen ligase